MNFDPSTIISFETNQLKRGMHSRSEIEGMVRFHCVDLQTPKDGDAFGILMAICGQESSFGAEDVPTFDPYFSRNSVAYSKDKLLQDCIRAHGAHASCAYGPFQIEFYNAVLLGYPIDLSPSNLWSPVVSLPFVIEYLNRCYRYGTQTVLDLFAQYNAGWGILREAQKDPNKIPQKYVQETWKHYCDVIGKKS